MGTHPIPPVSSPSSSRMSTQQQQQQPKGHSRHDTALIHGLTTSEVQQLSEACIEAKGRAYCPYSNFRVGCSILLTNGEVVRGANVENAAYPVGTCAERVTIGTAVTQHRGKKGDFRVISVPPRVRVGCVGSLSGNSASSIVRFSCTMS